MVDANSSESPVESLSPTIGQRTIDAFETLGNQTRLAILLALWESMDPTLPPSDGDGTLSFSELYDRVELRDSGNFTYHLDKLVDDFVEETEAGYALTTRAEEILRAVLAGTLADPSPFEAEPIEGACYRCEAPVVADYDDGHLTVRCTSCEGIWESSESQSGVVIKVYRPPVGQINRTPKEFHQAGNTWDRHRRFSLMEGSCPDCSGSVTASFHGCAAHDTDDDALCDHCGSLFEVQSLFVCDVCKLAWRTPGWAAIFTEMAVKAFYYDRGLDHDALFDSFAYKRIQDTIQRVELRSENPNEVAVTVELDGDRLDVVLDSDARVIDVDQGRD